MKYVLIIRKPDDIMRTMFENCIIERCFEYKKEVGFTDILKDLDDIPDVCKELIQRDYGVTREEAALMFEQLWIQAYGLGSMCAMHVIRFSDEEIGRRLSVVFAGLVMLIKFGKVREIYTDVEKKTDGTYHGKELSDFPFVEDVPPTDC